MNNIEHSNIEHSNIEHPKHYTWIDGIECSDVTKHFDCMSGSAIEYIWRHNHKGKPVEDLKKAVERLQIRIAHLEAKETKKTLSDLPEETVGPGGETILTYSIQDLPKRKPKPVIDDRTIDQSSAIVTCPNCAKTASNAPGSPGMREIQEMDREREDELKLQKEVKEALENYVDGR